MVSKPSGPRPAGQGRSKRRAPAPTDHQVPDVVGDRPPDPHQAGPSHAERGPAARPPGSFSIQGASGGGSSTTHTMPPGMSSSGQGRSASKGTVSSSKGAGKSSGQTSHSHSLPGHTAGATARAPPPRSRAESTTAKGGSPPRGASGGHSPQRGAGTAVVSSRGYTAQRGGASATVGASGGAAHGGTSGRTSNVTSSSARVEVRQEQLPHPHPHPQHTHRARDPKERHQRQAHTLPPTAAPPAAPIPATASVSPREGATSAKAPKESKERYTRQTPQKRAASTLPHGGASVGSNSRVAHAYHHGTATSSTRPSGSATNLSASAPSVHHPKHAHSSRDTQSQRRHSPSSPPGAGASVVVERGATGITDDRDIARITVDARAVVGRRAGRGGQPGVNLGSQARVNLGSQTVGRDHGASGVSPASAHPSSTSKSLPVDHHYNPKASSSAPTPHSSHPARSTRTRAPSPPRGGGARATSNSPPLVRGSPPEYGHHASHHHLQGVPPNPPGPVDLSNLRLDVVDYNSPDQGVVVGGAAGYSPPSAAATSNPILTNQLSAGISYGRPERPETTEALPDILNSHILPPYTVRQNQHRPSRSSHPSRSQGRANPSRSRGRRSRGRRSSSGGMTQLDDEEKGCCSHEGCLRCVTVLTTFRWVLVSLALLGVTCVVTGIVLGALHMTVGSSFLTLSLMFIGLGVMLVIVVGVGWKCTPQGHEPCHLLFNLGDHCTRDVRATSHRRHRDRNHWYGGVTYPEFRYRRPPPSYNASMQEFQQQLMLAQLQLNTDPSAGGVLPPADRPPGDADDNYSLPSSPPPSYKSRASTIRPGLHITFPPQGPSYPSSQPPTYRSRVGTAHNRPSLNLEDGGVDNPACSDVDVETPWTSSASSATSSGTSSAVTSPASSRTSPARSLADSATSSTLHRAADQVVGYLDNVLQDHDRTLEHHGAAGGGVGAGHPEKRTGKGAVKGSKGAEGGVDVKTSRPSEAALRHGASLNSVRTTASLEETNRIQDTPL